MCGACVSNEDFEAAQNQLIYFTGSLSENNLFGWRKYLAAVFVMDQGEMAFGPQYIDPTSWARAFSCKRRTP